MTARYETMLSARELAERYLEETPDKSQSIEAVIRRINQFRRNNILSEGILARQNEATRRWGYAPQSVEWMLFAEANLSRRVPQRVLGSIIRTILQASDVTISPNTEDPILPTILMETQDRPLFGDSSGSLPGWAGLPGDQGTGSGGKRLKKKRF